MAACPDCGSTSPPGSKACSSCGADLAIWPAPRPGALGDDATMRAILPVGRTPLAIAAGYLGLLSFFLIPAPLALVVGLLAVRGLKRHPDKHGMGRAVFGIVMGVLGTALLAILIATRH